MSGRRKGSVEKKGMVSPKGSNTWLTGWNEQHGLYVAQSLGRLNTLSMPDPRAEFPRHSVLEPYLLLKFTVEKKISTGVCVCTD